jgi:hypothetical protein
LGILLLFVNSVCICSVGEPFAYDVGYREDAYQQRNQWMVDMSSRVIAVFNGKPSGTMYTIQYAEGQKIPVEYLAG